MIKWLSILIILLFNNVQASDYFILKEKCNDIDGKEVKILISSITLSLWNSPAISTYSEEDPVIMFDVKVIDTYSKESIYFIFFHECTHLSTGQVQAIGETTWQRQIQEDVADCHAAKQYVRRFGHKSLKKAINDMKAINNDKRTKHILNCGSK